MKRETSPFAKQTSTFVLRMFFSVVKLTVVLFVLTVGVLVAGQSSVAPVSVRLLTSYGMEYAVSTLKPYRHLFPEPYLINIED